MGREIAKSRFSPHDFSQFAERLRNETELLADWFRDGDIAQSGGVAGFELEAWLVDDAGTPVPRNQELLQRLDPRFASLELAQYNLELNATPRALSGAVLTELHDELLRTWKHAKREAEALGCRLCMIGTLPSASPEQLDLGHMSAMARYRALNEQVLLLRGEEPLRLRICGREDLRLTRHDVMLEAAATSFQIHLQVSARQAVQAYNAALLISAPMVAVSANAPFLFGRDLWDETRIPLFEQAVSVGSEPYRRVGFGSGYLRASLMECFEENQAHYPVLLPTLYDEPLERLAHLRFHNGTIWRWNRPLIGFSDGQPHVRIEHRVVPAGPTIVDQIANAAFFYGLMASFMEEPRPVEQRLDFAIARRNFYEAARHGLRAEIRWLEDCNLPIHRLLMEQLVPQARRGLEALGIDAADVHTYLGIIAARVASGNNGANWQRHWRNRHGSDYAAMCRAYVDHQESNQPVHSWSLG